MHLAKFSSIDVIELDTIKDSKQFDISINGIRSNYTSIAASFSIDGTPYAVVNIFNSSDRLALLSSY